MLLRKEVPKQEIRKLKAGDFYIDGKILWIQKSGGIVSMITSEGNLYNAHIKNGTYTLFKINRHNRKIERAGLRTDRPELSATPVKL